MRQLTSSNADRNLASIVTVLTHTPSATVPLACIGLVLFGDGTKNLDGTGGDFELTITVGGQTVQPNPQTITFGTEPRSAVWTTVFPVPANAEVVLRAKSPNAGDTDVDVTAYLFEASPLQPATAGQTIGLTSGAVTLADGAHGGTSATLRLGGASSTPAFYVTNSSGDAVQFEATGGNGRGLELVGNGSGDGLKTKGGSTGTGGRFEGGSTSGTGLLVKAHSATEPMYLVGGGEGHGIYFSGAGDNEAFHVEGTLTVSDAITLSGAITAINVGNALRLGTLTIDATGWLTATGLEASAVSEIQSGLATAANQAAIAAAIAVVDAIVDKLDSAMVQDGAVYQFTTNALELGPSATAAQVWAYGSRTLTSVGSVTVVSPVSDEQDITIVQGDDYSSTTDDALTFNSADWPSLTGATVVLSAKRAGVTTQFSMTVVDASTVKWEPTDTQTSLLTAGKYRFDIQATLTSGLIKTLVIGEMTVTEDVTDN